MPGPTCSICERPDRADIDRRLVAGASNRAIAREIGVSEATVRRHRRHLSAPGSEDVLPALLDGGVVLAILPDPDGRLRLVARLEAEQ